MRPPDTGWGGVGSVIASRAQLQETQMDGFPTPFPFTHHYPHGRAGERGLFPMWRESQFSGAEWEGILL